MLMAFVQNSAPRVLEGFLELMKRVGLGGHAGQATFDEV